MVTLLKITV
jgi:hypothetical protein